MRDYLSKIFTGDKILWGIIFILFIISGVEMFSAISSSAYKAAARGSNHLAPFFGHLIHLGIGGLALVVIQKIPFDKSASSEIHSSRLDVSDKYDRDL